ncbi:hypothetical protein BJ085DRAFT_36076 [Dimargaris cristalligena]|uniref:Prolyl endopeptidase-like n=1 Tax=Dimargaris cristalligena TaxID=215637 RepID=A0A4P9ZNW3_9FUNG|nr:hypothetical protein BJ085DRAFT_36076 [Dimargaris cristalligena]|eukprot:RKP34993.1 hypothetical protein BJ085DRAFT_36076 [Dimargaris cristalligena]
MAFPSPALTNPELLEAPRAERISRATTYYDQTFRDSYQWLMAEDPRSDPKIMAHLESENAYAESVLGTQAGLRSQVYRHLLEATGTISCTDSIVSPGQTNGGDEDTEQSRQLNHLEFDRAPTEPGSPPRYIYYWRITGTHPRTPRPHFSASTRTPRQYLRRPYNRPTADREEVLLDFSHSLFACHSVHSVEVSPDHRWIAYVVDTTGVGKLSLYLYDTRSRALSHQDQVHNVTPAIGWASGGRILFYCTPTTAQRPGQVYRHRLHTNPQQSDVPILSNYNPDAHFDIRISASRRLVFFDLVDSAQQQNQTHYLQSDQAAHPDVSPTLIQPFHSHLRYFVEHWGNHLVILANREGAEARINGQVFICPLQDPLCRREHWRPLVPYDSQIYVQRIFPFANHLVLWEQSLGKSLVRVVHLPKEQPPNTGRSSPYYIPPRTTSSGHGRNTSVSSPASQPIPNELDAPVRIQPLTSHYLAIGDIIAAVRIHPAGQDYYGNQLRYTVSSLARPPTTYEYRLDTQRKRELWASPLHHRFQAHQYTQERLFVDPPRVKDSFYLTPPRQFKIPVSLVYHAEHFRGDGSNPAVLLLDGCEGRCFEPEFNPQWQPLLDRGYVVVIAHVRGGSENGRAWHEVFGKYLQKKSSAYDLLAVAHALAKRRYTSAHRLAVMTFSEGAGMIAAAAINLKPALFRVAVLQSPATDVLNALMTRLMRADDSTSENGPTKLDHDPFATTLREEYGDPTADEAIFKYIASYSPYHHVNPKHRGRVPHILVHTHLDDSRAKYWQSTKWVSQLRHRLGSALATGSTYSTRTPSHSTFNLSDADGMNFRGGSSGRHDQGESMDCPDHRDLLLMVGMDPDSRPDSHPNQLTSLHQLATNIAFIIEKLENSMPDAPRLPSLYISRNGQASSREIDFDAIRTSCSSQS